MKIEAGTLEVRLSKPATETFTINYKFVSDSAIQDEDYGGGLIGRKIIVKSLS